MKPTLLSLIGLLLIGSWMALSGGCSSSNTNAATPFVNPVANATPQHAYLTQWGGQNGANTDLNDPVAVAVNSAGTTVYVADQNDGCIKAFSPAGVYYSQWFVSLPTGVMVDASGSVYVTSADGNDLIQKFSPSGTLLADGGGVGSGNGLFSGPIGLASEGTTFLVADAGNNLVQAVTFTSGSTPSFGVGWVSQWNGSFGDTFSGDKGVAINAAGTFAYVADTGNYQVQEFTNTGAYVRKWGSQGINESQFNKPQGIAVDANGKVYVADTGNNRIQIFDSAGNYIYQWGSLGSGTGDFKTPTGVAIDASGNVYVADSGNNLVQKFGP